MGREAVEMVKSERDISRGRRILVDVLCSGICEVRLSFKSVVVLYIS